MNDTNICLCSCQLEDVGGKVYIGTLEEFTVLGAEERARLVQGTLASRWGVDTVHWIFWSSGGTWRRWECSGVCNPLTWRGRGL